MSGQTRRRLSIDIWREVMRRFDASGSTVSAFCADEGLNSTSFYRWRARLADVTGAPGAVHELPVPEQAKQRVAPQFIDLGNLADPSNHGAANLELRLELGGGLVLHLLRR